MKKNFMTLIFINMMIAGCGNINVCPPYPKPSQNVLNKIKSLESQEVDDWIVKQYKLNQKLKACNE